jgi:precorrin-2 dehydrogenase / sirohydrochlorin ferrochelatase
MPLFPAFLKLEGRHCLVVGAGAVAEEKIQGLLAAGAVLTVVAPSATKGIHAWHITKKLRLVKRGYRASDLKGNFLAIAATSSPTLHARIFRDARRRGVLCNVVDDPLHCDFYYGSVVRRGALQIAISTEGRSPALAQRLRKQFENEFGAEYAKWLDDLGVQREKLFKKSIPPQQRRELLHQIASDDSLKQFLRRAKRRKK